MGSTGKIGLSLSVDDKNNPDVLLYDSSSKLRTELTGGTPTISSSGNVWPGLFLHDAAGRARVSLFVSETGYPLFALNDAEGKVFFSTANNR
jgi:hypothetical protein